MKITGDFHTHSHYSDGRNNIENMVDAAREKGLKTIAITDHGPANIGAGVRHSGTFLTIKDEIKKIQKNRPDIKILAGAEANVISCKGDIDIPGDIIDQLDILLIGLHPYVKPKSFRDGLAFVLGNQLAKIILPLRNKVAHMNTKALVEAVHKHKVDVVTHPGLGLPVDIEEVARACVDNDTAFEINTGHNYQSVEQIRRAAKTGVKFIINSDAHFTKTVGELEPGLALLAQVHVPLKQIVNVEV